MIIAMLGRMLGGPLLEDDAHVLEAGSVQRVAQEPHGTRGHASIGVPIGQHVGTRVEGVEDADGEIVSLGEVPKVGQGSREGAVRQVHIIGSAAW